MQETLGYYRIVEPIGSGGMGTVYRARDERLERDVAVKVLSAGHLADDDSRQRFRREALSLSKLNHPNIATIHAFETFDDLDVLVMEHIPGRDLAEAIRGGPLPEREVIRLGVQLLHALDAAHARGVVHRDLKPGNVRVTPDGWLKVLDFGLARVLQADGDATTETLTAPGFAGTIPYMAPEQVRGGVVDARTDIYGAGAVLYELATGRRVHAGLSGARLLGAILEEPPDSARSLNNRVSPALEQVLVKALDKDPQLRYQSAREMCVDLERLMAPDKTIARHRSRRPLIAASALAIVALAAFAGWFAWWREDPFPGRILVADFDDRAGDPAAALVVRDLLTLHLQQSRSLNVISHEQVLDGLGRMGRSARDPLDAATAAELCQREAIPLLLAGTARASGDSVVLAVQAIEPVSGALHFVETVTFDDDGALHEGVNRLASRLRRRLGESLAGIQADTRPLEDVTTPSLDALKLYSRGSEAIRHGDPDEAQRLLSAALELDPSFAMAHREIARAFAIPGNASRARDHLQRAFELRDRLTQRERLLVEGSYYNALGDYERAVHSLTAATNLYPTDSRAQYELALAYRDMGHTARSNERLAALLEREPTYTPAYVLVLELASAGEYDKAQALYEQGKRHGIRSPQLDWGHGMVLIGRGRYEDARRQFIALEGYSRVYAGIARLNLATIDILAGELTAAADRLRADIVADRQSGDLAAEVRRRYLLGQLLDLMGRRDEALAEAAAMLRGGHDRLRPDDWLMAGTLLARLGDVKRAPMALEQLEIARHSAPSAFVESCVHNLTGEIALAEQRPREAVEAFTAAAAAYYAGTHPTHGLARAFSALGEWPRAREAWTRVIDARGEMFQYGLAADWVLAHLERARASREAEDLSAARADYDAFLDFWRDARRVGIVEAAARERQALGNQ